MTISSTKLPPCFIIAVRPLLLSLLATTYDALIASLTTSQNPHKRRKSHKPHPARIADGKLLRVSPSRHLNILYATPVPSSNSPCIVLEAGANSWSPMWASVSAQLEPHFRVLRYDRAGYGSSAPANVPRPVSAIVDDLYHAVTNVPGPYILVAHSLGALFINDLTTRLDDVIGIVYVDAASVETVRMLRGIVPSSVPPAWLARFLESAGVLRVLAPALLRPYASVFKGELGIVARRTWATSEWLLAYTSEWVAAQKLCEQVSGCPPRWLGDLPISAIVPDIYERTSGKAYVGDLQRAVASYSDDAVVVDVENCGHFVQIERPDVVVDAVWSVFQRARDKSSLKDEMSFTA